MAHDEVDGQKTMPMTEMDTAPSTIFPNRLYHILCAEDPNIIRWSADGTAFQIVDSERFCQQVLPKYFRHSKLTSFQRQLNLYGFTHATKSPKSGTYAHPYFQRGSRQNLKFIKRMVRKGPAPGFPTHTGEDPLPPPAPPAEGAGPTLSTVPTLLQARMSTSHYAWANSHAPMLSENVVGRSHCIDPIRSERTPAALLCVLTELS